MTKRVRGQRWAAVIMIGLVLVGAVGSADAQSDADLRRERERVRSERAAMAGDLDITKAETDEMLAALSALETNVRAEEARLDEAQRTVAAAEAQVAEALAAQAAAEADVEELRRAMARMAVDAYISPPDQDNLTIVLTGELVTAPERQALLEMSATNRADVLERFRAAVEDREIQRETAEAAQRRALDAQAEVQSRLQTVEEARDEQALLAAQVQQRLDALLQQDRDLQSQDRQITDELARREAARKAEEERRRLAELQAQLARASARSGPVNVPGRGTISLSSVRGITVNSQIAGQLERMLAHAASDGIVLGGGGYRDGRQQIALRRSNCGSSNFAIYEMSPSQCRPPTARPGSSLHEQGLAIDFTANGRSISSRNTDAFRWLAANAASYGFYNLPSEPWHWSTTGQ